MKKRIAFVLLGLILGITSFINFENLNIIYLALPIGLISLFFYRKNKDYAIFFLAVFLGFSMASFKLTRINPKEASNVDLNFTIIDKKMSRNSYRYTIKNHDTNKKAFMFEEADFDIGDKIKARGDLRLVNTNTNPNLFSYRSYAISRGVGLEFKADNLDQEITRQRSKNIFLSFRRSFTTYINRIFKENLSKDSADFVISVILADSLFDKTEVNKLGLAHILAVSGFHIDLLMTFMIFLLSKIGISYKKSMTISLSLALIYGYIIGFSYSILRVLIVNTISFMGFLQRRAVDRVKALMVAAIIILFINPFAILNTGFVLSFATMLAIFKIYPRVKKIFNEGFIRDRLAFSTSIQLGVMPFGVYYFRYFNFLSIIANLIIVPVFEISMYIIFGLIFLYPLFRILLKPGFFILDMMISSIFNMTEFLSKTRLFTIEFMAESIFISLYLFVLILLFANIKNKKNLGIFIKASLFIVLIAIAASSLDKDIEYQMIDIGQGDAFLINDRGKYYMVDVGGPKYKDYDSGERILVPYLKSLGIREIEAVFISHEDGDHAGNLDILRKNIRVKNIITDDKVSVEFKDKYQPKIIKKDEQIKLSHGNITCISDGAGESEDINDQSLGLLIEIGETKILTLGDLSKENEDKLDIKANILKLSHHGSATSSSKQFIEKVDPDLVLISAGRNNTYGHPNKEVLANIGDISKCNTQTDGLVTIKFYKEKVEIEKYLKGGFFR